MAVGPLGRESFIASVVPTANRGSGKSEAAARLLGECLRQLRKDRGLALKDVAPVIRGSVSKLSRIERGESPPKDRDVYDLALFYGLHSDEELHTIDTLLKQAKESAWWDQYSDVAPTWFRRLIGLEGTADEICTYEDLVVPGLLQTEAYAHTIVNSGLPHASSQEVKRRVELRLARQYVLGQPQGPRVVALLDESILHRTLGGPEVMREQLRHLRQAAEHPRVNIRIVRFAAFASGRALLPGSPITHLRFKDGGPAELIYLEQMTSAVYVTKSRDVDQYRHVLAELRLAAASRKDSLGLLDDAMERLRP